MAKAWNSKSELPVQSLPDDIENATSEEEWGWLVELCFGDWSTRLWMLQEQFLHSENIILHGKRLLSWEAVAILPSFFLLGPLPIATVDRFWRHTGRFETSRS